MMRALLAIAALLCVPRAALACGGMFCDAVQPVDQAAERIVFAWAEDDTCSDGRITVEVQISYEGDADDFAWVVPVPDVPELFVSNDAAFTVLANATVPTFPLVDEEFGTCDGGMFTPMRDADSAGAEGGGDDQQGGVNVIASETVGPYDTVVLQATNAGVLVEWLQEQDYAIPSDLEPVLQPYLAEQQYFVALKLSSHKDAGDLSPLGMTYCGHAASIPIQLTSVASIDDLPIEVFVLGPTRAVPDNYLHVRINEAAIDWYGGGLNYRDVVRRAANEAGGQAFATDFSGRSSMFSGRFWNDAMLDLDELRNASSSVEWLEGIVFSSLPPSSQLTALLTEWAPAPAGVDQADFLQCPGCYADEVTGPFDAALATDALQAEIIEPLDAMQARVDATAHVTRLFTTMDPAEMTVDPQFVFNPDLEQDLASVHTATNEIHCGLFEKRERAERVLVLPDGREIDLPSEAHLANTLTNEFVYMDELTSPAAIVIEDLGASGQGTIIADYRDEAALEAASFGRGCACATASPRSLAAALVLLAGLVIRRRSSR
jgi:hypothetical protein